MNDIIFFGALRVILDNASGRVLAVQDRISGESASFRFSPDYITRACTHAQNAWASLSQDA